MDVAYVFTQLIPTRRIPHPPPHVTVAPGDIKTAHATSHSRDYWDWRRPKPYDTCRWMKKGGHNVACGILRRIADANLTASVFVSDARAGVLQLVAAGYPFSVCRSAVYRVYRERWADLAGSATDLRKVVAACGSCLPNPMKTNPRPPLPEPARRALHNYLGAPRTPKRSCLKGRGHPRTGGPDGGVPARAVPLPVPGGEKRRSPPSPSAPPSTTSPPPQQRPRLSPPHTGRGGAASAAPGPPGAASEARRVCFAP